MRSQVPPPPSNIDNPAGTDTIGVKAIVNDLKHISNGHGKGIVRGNVTSEAGEPDMIIDAELKSTLKVNSRQTERGGNFTMDRDKAARPSEQTRLILKLRFENTEVYPVNLSEQRHLRRQVMHIVQNVLSPFVLLDVAYYGSYTNTEGVKEWAVRMQSVPEWLVKLWWQSQKGSHSVVGIRGVQSAVQLVWFHKGLPSLRSPPLPLVAKTTGEVERWPATH